MAGKLWLTSVFCLSLLITFAFAQEAQPLTEEALKQQEARETQAYALLDQVISDAQSLRLPENRINVLISAGDMLWKHDEVRARALFNETSAAVRDMFNALDPNDTDYSNEYRTALNTRQEFLLALSRLDPKLAYDLMLATRPNEQMQQAQQGQRGQFRGRNNSTSESDLEMRLLAEVAEADPILALRKAQDLLNDGRYPNSLIRTLLKLNESNAAMAKKLSDTLIEKLSVETLIKGQDAGNLAIALLIPGPLPTESKDAGKSPAYRSDSSNQVLNQSDYQRLLQNVVTAGLSYTPPTDNANSRGNTGRRGGQGGGRGGQFGQVSEQAQQQVNSQRLYFSLTALLKQIETYLPNKAALVKQKLGQYATNSQQRQMQSELNALAKDGTVEAILAAAGTAPPAIQSRYYQMAAIKAVNEGNTAAAEQISQQFLNEQQRAQITRSIDRQKVKQVTLAGNIDQMRQSIQRLRSDDERVDLLVSLAVEAWKQKNEGLARQLIDEVRPMVNRRARNYRNFDAQLNVARACSEIDSKFSFEILEIVIAQLNEIIPAASILSGFDVRIFKNGEMPLSGNSSLHQIIRSFGDELSVLARQDFDRVRMLGDQFQQIEPRTSVRLAIIRGALGLESNGIFEGDNSGPFQNFGPRGGGRRPQ